MSDDFGHGCVSGCHGAETADMNIHLGRLREDSYVAAVAGMRADVDNGTWDGPAAMSACGKAENPASCFSAICAGKKAGDPKTAEAHALPHHSHPGAPPNHNGVANALARLDQTEGLTNKAAAKAHLEAHMSAISGSGAKASGRPNERRAEAYQGTRRGPTAELARLEPFRATFEREDVMVNGKAMAQLDGYASMTGVEYEMYDIFGPYGETINVRAFDQTLQANPDVAFLLNHKGMTMARTTNQTLHLDADPRGLHSRAYVNPDRTDVRDLLIAIDDKNVTEMSFAFMLLDGQWDEEFEHFEILQCDLDRGDVSAVNYGANPYTSIGARARDVLADVMQLPRGAQMAAYERLSVRLNGSPPRLIEIESAISVHDDEAGPDVVRAAQQGRSTEFYEAMLKLDA